MVRRRGKRKRRSQCYSYERRKKKSQCYFCETRKRKRRRKRVRRWSCKAVPRLARQWPGPIGYVDDADDVVVVDGNDVDVVDDDGGQEYHQRKSNEEAKMRKRQN